MIPVLEHLEIGEFMITRVLDGTFLVDGGAMFGVVPRTLWEKRAAPDRENRITLALNCYLIRGRGSTILVETGVGPDVDRRYIDFYSFRREPGLLSALEREGVRPDQVDVVVNSHLHFDHCGGNTVRAGDKEWRPAFPNALYIVQRGEWEQARNPIERDRPSYIPARLTALGHGDSLSLLDGDSTIRDGVEAVLVPGHTAFHQGLKVTSGGRTFFYFGDTVPTSAHIDLPYITSYDLFPVETFNNKKKLYERAVAEDWVVGFSHDLRHAFGGIRKAGRRYEFVPGPHGPGVKKD
jgi:glyoxylase-like metal-dependent hydrolase (beta-lactamase superfamily II)